MKNKLNEAVQHLKLTGSTRTKTVKKNAYLSLIVLFSNNLVGFLFIPVVIGMIEPIRYGIWITINSVLNWFSLMDLGLGGGLRTRLAQALANNNKQLAKEHISTAYATLSFIVILAMLIFYLVQPYLDWVKIFNAPEDFASELSVMMLFVVLFFFARFSLQLINNVLAAFQMTFISSLVSFIAHLSSLLIIFFLFRKIDASLLLLGIIYTLSPLVVLLIVSIYLFVGKFREYAPSLRCIRKNSIRSIMSLGTFEFLDKIAFIVIVSATNLIISHIGSPVDVVPYSVSMRFVGLFLTVFNVVTEPITPAITEAYTQKDVSWVKSAIKKANIVSFIGVLLMFLSLPIVRPIVNIMLRGKVSVSYIVLMFATLLTAQRMLSNIFGRFLTGIGVIRLVVWVTMVSAIIYLPMVKLISSTFALGVLSVLISQIMVEIPIAATKVVQARKILSNKATGVWLK